MTQQTTIVHKYSSGDAIAFFSTFVTGGVFSQITDAFVSHSLQLPIPVDVNGTPVYDNPIVAFEKTGDYNKLANEFKRFVLAADIYTQPKTVLDGLVQKVLSSNRPPKGCEGSKGCRQKLTAVEASLAKEEAKLAKLLKSLASKDAEMLAEQHTTIMTLQATLGELYKEQIALVGQFFQPVKKTDSDSENDANVQPPLCPERVKMEMARKQMEEIKNALYNLEYGCRMRGRNQSTSTPTSSPTGVDGGSFRSASGDVTDANPDEMFDNYLRSLGGSPERGTPTVPDEPFRLESFMNAGISPPLTSPLFNGSKKPASKRPNKTSIRLAFLRKFKPYWFRSDKNYCDPSVFCASFPVHPLIDANLMARIIALKPVTARRFPSDTTLPAAAAACSSWSDTMAARSTPEQRTETSQPLAATSEMAASWPTFDEAASLNEPSPRNPGGQSVVRSQTTGDAVAFQEACSLLSVIYTRPKNRRGRAETGIVYDDESDDDDGEFDKLLERRNQIVIQCLHELLTEAEKASKTAGQTP